MSSNADREYLELNPAQGYPLGPDLYYECLRCGDVLPSEPDDDVNCTCRNLGIDVGFSRMVVLDRSKVRLFRRVEAR